jgi:hypothetical protein
MNIVPTVTDVAAVAQLTFWSALAPRLHVNDHSYLLGQGVMQIDDAAMQALRELMRTEGYFQLPPQEWGLPINEMADLVRALDERGLPLPFAFMYDEFWCLYLRLHRILEGLLGPGYLRLPDFWTWLVDPRRGQSGWSPHRDKGHWSLFADRSPKAVTVWIPLTEATTLNGCMYLVPADRDPTYGTPEDNQWKHKPSDIRALPAPAGSVFCWSQAVLHWGSRSSPRAADVRISVAFEFQSAAVEPFNQPLTSPMSVPDLQFRLQLIGKQILQYKHMYPLSPEVEAFATRLCGAGVSDSNPIS